MAYGEAPVMDGWTLCKDHWPCIPDEEKFNQDPRLYVILTKKGQALVAYPSYAIEKDTFQRDEWHAIGAGHVWQCEVVAYKPLDIPWPLISDMLSMPENRNKAFRTIYARYARP